MVGFGVVVALWVSALFATQWALQNWWQERYSGFSQQVLSAINQSDEAIFQLATDDLAGRMLLQNDALHVYTDHAPYRLTTTWQLASVNVDPLTWQNSAQVTATITASDVAGRLTLVLEREQEQARLQDLYFEIAPNR